MNANLPVPSKLLFVGMNNPRQDEPFWPRPHNTTGHILWRLINEAVGWTMEEYLGRTDRVNFCEGKSWSMDRARERLGEVQAMVEGRRTICVGVPAATLLGAPHGDKGWFIWDGLIAAIPHTSGLNRFYNDDANWNATVAFLRETMR